MSAVNKRIPLYQALLLITTTWFLTACAASGTMPPDRPPNVIIVLTDDQGIGDLGCHGNPWIKTPNFDDLYGEAVRMTVFRVRLAAGKTLLVNDFVEGAARYGVYYTYIRYLGKT